jgi:hypothetical protein
MKTSRIIGVLFAVVIAVGLARFAHEQGMAWDLGLRGPKHRVTLSWTPSPGAVSYKIYRTTISGRGYMKVGTSEEPAFTDKTVAAHTVYYYAVTSLGPDGSESARSSEIKAVVPE